MNKNRLNLDFSLTSDVSRVAYVSSYLGQIRNPSPTELETCANYILWGADANGQNVRQTGDIELETRHKTWDSRKIESLDALRESPTFMESQVKPLSERSIYRATQPVFSRAAARLAAPPDVRLELERLWEQIDHLEFVLQTYELSHGRRTKPIRSELVTRIAPANIDSLKTRATSMEPYEYLKSKHLLVELRRQQFAYRDLYAPVHLARTDSDPEPSTPIDFGVEIKVRPLDLKYGDSLSEKLFTEEIEPSQFSEEELQNISHLIWRDKVDEERTSAAAPSKGLEFDFCNVDHIIELILQLKEFGENSHLDGQTDNFLKTWDFYHAAAHLTDAQEDILSLKIEHVKNQEIADLVNAKYGKTYSANYISTIFRQKIAPAIATAAQRHLDLVKELFFPENWKKCRTCGRTLLISGDYFVKKTKSKDGFSNQCKVCDKYERDKKR